MVDAGGVVEADHLWDGVAVRVGGLGCIVHASRGVVLALTTRNEVFGRSGLPPPLHARCSPGGTRVVVFAGRASIPVHEHVGPRDRVVTTKPLLQPVYPHAAVGSIEGESLCDFERSFVLDVLAEIRLERRVVRQLTVGEPRVGVAVGLGVGGGVRLGKVF